MQRSITSIIIICLGLLWGQTLDSLALDTVRTFRSLSSAMSHPLEVFKLDLSKQKLSEIPAEVFEMKNLNVLVLQRNKIKSLPDNFDQLPHLQIVDMERNKIDSLPPSLFQCKGMKELHFGMNQIRTIPDEISKLEQLRVLDIWSNDLNYYSSELQHLKHLELLDIRAILINDEIKNMLMEWLPNTQIEASASCGCDL